MFMPFARHRALDKLPPCQRLELALWSVICIRGKMLRHVHGDGRNSGIATPGSIAIARSSSPLFVRRLVLLEVPPQLVGVLFDCLKPQLAA